MPGPGLFVGLALGANFFFSFYMYLTQEFLIPKRNKLGVKIGKYKVTGEEVRAFAKKQMFGYALIFIALAINNNIKLSSLCFPISLLFLIGVYFVLIGHWQIYRLDKMRSE